MLSKRTCDCSLNFSNRKLKIRTVIKFRKQTDFPVVYFIRASFVGCYVCSALVHLTKYSL